MSDCASVPVVFIIGGDDTLVRVSTDESLRAAKERALIDTRNTGRPPDEWEVRDSGGVLLDQDLDVGTYTFNACPDVWRAATDATRLYLTLRLWNPAPLPDPPPPSESVNPLQLHVAEAMAVQDSIQQATAAAIRARGKR